MSEHNIKTINMYNAGGAKEYIDHREVDPEIDKWMRLYNYVIKQIEEDKTKRIVELGSGCGQLSSMLQEDGYDVTATDIVDDFLNLQKEIEIKDVRKYNFLTDNYDDIFDTKADLIISWRNPHLDMDDMKKLFEVAYNALNENGLFIINFQNAEVHPKAELLPNGTKYNYMVLPDKPTKEERFYAYYSKEDIDNLREGLFDIQEYHNEGGAEKKNWHVLTLKKVKNNTPE